MSKQAGRGGGKFSSRLLDMKFMKRASEKKNMASAVKRKREDEDSSHWVATNGGPRPKGCVVVSEGDPPPGALVGRFSFQSFSPATDKLNSEAEDALAKAIATQNGNGEADHGEHSVSDAEMAQGLAKR